MFIGSEIGTTYLDSMKDDDTLFQEKHKILEWMYVWRLYKIIY